VNVDVEVGTEHLPLGAVLGKAVERGERIRWNGGTLPLDDVAIIVVVRRLHQHETKTTPHGSSQAQAAALYPLNKLVR